MRKTFYDACEEIDATVFSGDALDDSENRKGFREYLERWGRELLNFEQMEDLQDVITTKEQGL